MEVTRDDTLILRHVTSIVESDYGVRGGEGNEKELSSELDRKNLSVRVQNLMTILEMFIVRIQRLRLLQ